VILYYEENELPIPVGGSILSYFFLLPFFSQALPPSKLSRTLN
jgi:hypothetical protein